jgi:hypothetical protein
LPTSLPKSLGGNESVEIVGHHRILTVKADDKKREVSGVLGIDSLQLGKITGNRMPMVYTAQIPLIEEGFVDLDVLEEPLSPY